MDNTDWRAAQAQAQAQAQIPGQVMGNEAAAAQGMEAGDWRTQLQADSRQRIVNRIMETLKMHLPFSGQEGLQQLKKIAVRFEENIYTTGTSQSDYLRKISLKILTLENKSQNPMTKNPQDAASQSMQPQIQNQVQKLSMPMVSNQPQVRQQQLPQSDMASTAAPNSACMTSGLVPGGLSQGNMPNVAGGQNPNMQNIQDMSSVNPNAGGGTSTGQKGVPFANSKRPIPGRQQQEQQQSQNSQQLYPCNQQLQHHLMKQKLKQRNIPQSLLQSQIQQQQMQTTQLHSSQHAGIIQQTSLRQSSTSSSNLQQNHQSSLQQATQSMVQQQSQPVLRPPQQQHVQSQQQQQLSIMQQNLMPQQPSASNMQQNQLIGQQNSILDAQHQQQQRLMQQQQTTSQQNNLANMQQQQQNNLSGPQNNLSGFQQQIVGSQHGSLGLQANQQSVMLQQSKVAAPQQMHQNMPNLLPNQQNQQSQLQPPQQQMMSQIQSQPGQLQQLGSQQTGNPIQRDMQQRIQTSGSMIQQPAMIDQQKQLMQSQRIIPEVPLTSVDSSHAGNTNSGDWQEEIFQKIKSMNELYYNDLNEMYQRRAAKLQQHDSLPQQPKNEQLEKLRYCKIMLEKLIMFLRTNKNEIQPRHIDKYAAIEKQIINIVNSNRQRKPVSTLQPGQVSQSQMHAMQQSQQTQPQISQMHGHENQMSSHLQQMNAQGSVATMQQNNLTNSQHNSLSSISNSCQNNMNALQPGSNIDPGQGNAMNSIQKVAVSSMQQNPVSGPQQMNINSVASQGGVTTLQSNVTTLQASASIYQPQNKKQEGQMFSTQQLKQQYQQQQMQQQYMQRQNLLQQQHQTTAHQLAQLPAHQMGQINQMNDPNDMKMRQQIGGKSGVLQQHQRPSYQHQQMKTGAPFSISSPHVLQAASPQIGHHPSPQLDQQNLLSSHTKAGTPLQCANSLFIVPSPSTSMVPSPMPGDFSEKINSGVSSSSNAGNNVQHPNTGASVTAPSLAIGTPGISASPLLAEFTSPDCTQGVASTIISGNADTVEQPLECLLKVVKSISQKALRASVSDISSVVSMVDRIAGSAPGKGSRAAVGEDLAAMTKCRLQARNFFMQDGPSGSKKMRRYTSSMPSNVVSSTGSVNDSLRHLNGCESDGESTGASSIKRSRLEANHALEEELREINQRLIDTVVYISEDDVDPTTVSAAAEGGEGTIVKCSFSAVALSPNLKSQCASAQMSPIQPLRLLIPKDYPNCSPILLDKFPVEVSKEYEDLSIKAKSRFSISLRSLMQPMSLGEIARAWDICSRSVISEYAQQSGGGSFSSNYGTWETCLGGA